MQSHRPTRAFVLAAGYGTRMLPLSRDLPKPLMPLWGRPVLEHVLRLLRSWGVRDVVINSHHEPGAILNFARRNPVPGLRLTLSYEPEILGTGGALRRAQWFLGREPFWLINADIAADVEPGPFLRTFDRKKHLAALWLDPSRGPRTVEMHRGLITTFESRSPGSACTFTFCGLHLVSPRILEYLPHEGFAGIIAAYERAMRKGARIAGVCVPGSFWADLGSPRQYLDAHREVLRRYRAGRPTPPVPSAEGTPDSFPSSGLPADLSAIARRATAEAVAKAGGVAEGRGGSGRAICSSAVDDFVSIGANVRIERGAQIKNSVIWDGARIGSGSRVENAVVGRDTVVSGDVGYIAMRADRALDAAAQDFLRSRGWDAAHATALPMSPRGSARTFTRLRKGARSVILMQYSPEREENALYCDHARFLARLGLRVPAVLAHDRDRRLALLEDLGTASLQGLAPRLSAEPLRRLYREVLDAVLVLHRKGAKEARRRRVRLMPAFAAGLYRWERDLFARHFLEERLGLPPGRVRRITRDLSRVAYRLVKAPAVLIHRDLQSSNILLRRGRPAFIDFQGMRLGPAVYDLASLLCDPYMNLLPELQSELLEYYVRRCADARSVRDLFWWAAIERLAQALGAYARLSALPGMESFSGHIEPACEMLRRALDHVQGLGHLRRLVDDLLSGRAKRH